MKSLSMITLLLCGLALPITANAAANTATCDRPAKPSFPDPKTAPPSQVQKLNQDMQKYAGSMNAYVQCLSKEAQAAEDEGKTTITDYNQKFLPEYNKRATE